MGFNWEWKDGMTVKVDGFNCEEGLNGTVDVGGLIKLFKSLKEKETRISEEEETLMDYLEIYIEVETFVECDQCSGKFQEDELTNGICDDCISENEEDEEEKLEEKNEM